jgi:hypothetical protein
MSVHRRAGQRHCSAPAASRHHWASQGVWTFERLCCAVLNLLFAFFLKKIIIVKHVFNSNLLRLPLVIFQRHLIAARLCAAWDQPMLEARHALAGLATLMREELRVGCSWLPEEDLVIIRELVNRFFKDSIFVLCSIVFA